MKIVKEALLVCILFASTNCKSKNDSKAAVAIASQTTNQDLESYETAYFASGCFWCVEAIFESVIGVKEVVSGYAGGHEKNPTYETVGSGRSSHAEAVVVYYNPKEVSFATLIKVFFGSHDPTTLNRQGPDKGTQYRSIAFYKSEAEKKIILNYMSELTTNNVYKNKIITEVVSHTKFYEAEDYHQDYEKKHPTNSYIRNVSVPRLNRFKSRYPELVKKNKH